MNLDAVLRIAAKVTGAEAVQSLGRAVGSVGKAADGAKASFKNVVNSSAWQGAAVVATGIGVALGVATKQAIEFESAVADVRKVVSGLDTPAGLTAIRQEILQLSREMPITAQGFAEIYAAAGQSGIAREQIRAFAIDVTKMAVAFDMTAADAGNAMAKMRTALGLSQPQVASLADALNYLSNNTASTGAELVNFTQRSGVMGKQAGLSAEQTAAFGAAMIGAGVEVEVAATSFNNMIRALSRGASMTARQESALKRLGLASRTVADGEREMTAAVQRGSDRRLEILQDESDRQQAELRKRYRRQLQLLEDQWEDESDAYTDGLQDQTDTQIKALQRQADARIKILQKQAGDNEAWLDQQTDAVRDQLEAEIDALRDSTDRALKIQQRADRDKRQQVRDSMDERMEDEAQALERINKQRVDAEKEGTRQAIEAAKAAAGEGGSEAGKAMAKRLQDDALGTVRDVFQRIKGLAAEEQISVISDLFGDEARGLAPLISNLGNLEQALGMVGDKTKYAGSMTKEYEVRSQTAANALQLAQNNFNALAIEIGAQVVPALIKVVQFLNPVIIGLSKFASANPQITAVAVAVAGLASAFVLAAPFIVATITVLAGISAATLGPIALVVAAVVGLGAAFILAWQNFKWFRDGLTAGWAGIVQGWQGAFTLIKGILAGDSAMITKGYTMLIDGIKAATVAGFQFTMRVIGEALAWIGQQIIAMPGRIGASVRALGMAIGNGIANAVKGIFRGMLQWMADRINWMAGQINRLVRTANKLPGVRIPELDMVSVPKFARGGYVTGPTLGLVGEAGREYIVPEAKAAGFANNIMAGRRGASAIPSGSSSSGGGGSSPTTINITTGPIRQDASGQRWMTLEDGEKMVRQAVGQMQRTSRTPGGRYASGVR